MSALRQVWLVMAAAGGMRLTALMLVLLLLAGWGLLALSGWFITATAVAGLTSAGLWFDVFRPAASVRGLAILRTAARYGERVLGHEATLAAVLRLRRGVLAGLAAQPWPDLTRLRRGRVLTQVTADCDALDGLPLRLILPAIGGAVALAICLALLWWLVGAALAIWIVATHALGAVAIGLWALPKARGLALAASVAGRAHSAAVLEVMQARDVLVMTGQLPAAEAAALDFDASAREALAQLDRLGRDVASAQAVIRIIAASGALALAGQAMVAGRIGPGLAAMCFFAALALSELTAPLRRAVAEYGRIADAASRVAPLLAVTPPSLAPASLAAQEVLDPLPLRLDDLTLRAGQVLLITGASGAGKSTLLAQIAGLIPAHGRQVTLGGTPPADWPEDALWNVVALVPQRPALIAGTLRENLHLAAPDADDAAMHAALTAMCLDHLREGLDLRLGQGGEGLSGGERRRLALTRAILRKPRLLLLDEPTEGLDQDTARMVLNHLTNMPNCAVVLATHRHIGLIGHELLLNLS